MAGTGHPPYACPVTEQVIRFTGEEGRRIAWAQTGDGPPAVFAGWWMSHLELNWREPRFRAFVEALGRHRTVIRYDAPETGLSGGEPAPGNPVESGAAALAAVIDAAGGGPVDLIAASSGAPVGLAHAAAHPETVRTLVVYGGYAAGSGIADARSRQAVVDLVRAHWGLGSRALADVFMPSATADERAAFVAFQRQAASAERAARALEAVYAADATTSLPHVRPGAVVLHRRGDRAIPFELGRELAATLPEATFVTLDGADHFAWFGDAEQVVDALLDALETDRDARSADRSRPAGGDDLTAREAEVLGLIAGGLSDREIAERLVLSPHTVHRHVANVRTKLGLPTRAAAVAAAARRGLL